MTFGELASQLVDWLIGWLFGWLVGLVTSKNYKAFLLLPGGLFLISL